jgi:hypothetical protein
VNRPPHSRPALLLALGLLLTPTAWAQTELVALHPCAIIGVKAKAQIEELQAICATELARSDAQLVPSNQVRDFLEKEAKGSCARSKERNACLGKLAAATQASRTVLISIDPGQVTRVSGVVVTPEGEVVDQKSIQMRNRGQPVNDVVRTAVTRLREQLTLLPPKLAALVEQPAPLTPPEPPPPPPSAEPPPAQAQAAPPPPQPTPATPAPAAAVSQAAPSARTWKTPTAYATAGAGVVALGLAGFFALQASNTLDELDAPYRDGRFPRRDELPQLAERKDKLSTQRTLSGVSAALGAALVGTGVYLWLSDRPGSTTPGATALSAGPGGVKLRVLLP